MYQTGEAVVYGNNGVCRVAAVGNPAFSWADPCKLYYTLTPVFGVGVIYVPVDTPVYMRPSMTREEAEALIARIPAIREVPLEETNQRMLAEHYQAAVRSHSCSDLISLIKTIYARETARGKKPRAVDQRFRKQAEELLHGELSVALGIPRDSIADYIRSCLSKRPPLRA